MMNDKENYYICKNCGHGVTKLKGDTLSVREVCFCGGKMVLYKPAAGCNFVRVYYDRQGSGFSRPVTCQRSDQPYSMTVSDFFTNLISLSPIQLNADLVKIYFVETDNVEKFICALTYNSDESEDRLIIERKWRLGEYDFFGCLLVPVYPRQANYSADYLGMKLLRR